jgi:hypothetical protein
LSLQSQCSRQGTRGIYQGGRLAAHKGHLLIAGCLVWAVPFQARHAVAQPLLKQPQLLTRCEEARAQPLHQLNIDQDATHLPPLLFSRIKVQA